MNLEREKMKRDRGTIRIRKVVRSQQARIRVQQERNIAKMRRLGALLRNACFLKCWMNLSWASWRQKWVALTNKAIHFNEVVGGTLKRWLSGEKVRSFDAMKWYAEAKAESRQKAHKAAMNPHDGFQIQDESSK
jgi:hypothetical protein